MGMGPTFINGNGGGRNIYSVSGQLDTTTPTVSRGTNFSVSKTGTGDVTITLTVPFGGGIDFVGITPINAAGAGAGTAVCYKIVTSSLTSAGFRVQFQTDAGAAVDTEFAFELRGSIDSF